ncbi:MULTISPECIES: ion channel [unclassified Methylophaga]|uniref:Two pore domain potassium channel family protein n=1 Tax=Pseudidiomarina aestuarii TaxID=624146 RepID=A0A2T4CZB8_9GAMM|nr:MULTISPECIES: ion channel [unclassified Methylophaga]PTB86895.1 two pore domain potassium channel family protein [Pseudidiomarina aestuarii]MAL49894.1 Ion transport 2 [Methylophaga sp.]MAP26380.1 Ion transport 2 [Methylophaga sp.]MBP24769.1 Ion transport 2 [Methylophaga sp.]HAD31665.1 two pore domain potassium channel family protein [Methylophaga sp.]
MLEFLTDAQVVTVLVTALVVGLVVVFHYEVIQQLNRWCPNHPSRTAKHRHRPIILATMFVLLFAHIIEIWLFGVAFWGLLSQTGYGYISGYEHISLLDSVYFSAATYTTVGWGDLAATGHIRFLAGTEALVGFMMITWSASFSYLIMARAWGSEND